MTGSSRFWFSVLAGFVVLLGLNLLARSQLYSLRTDFTEDGLFTVSDASETILHDLKEPITLRFFFSEKQATGLPVFQAYAARIKAMLRQFADISGGTLKVEFLQPEPFTEAEDLAVAHGLEGITMDAAGSKFYFGLSAENSTDDKGVLAFFDPEREQFLEYDIMRLISDVAHPERKKIAVISSLPLRGSAGGVGIQALYQFSQPWSIYTELENLFDLKVIDKTTKRIDADVDALWVVNPAGLTEENLYAIDQYILGGGKALIMLDANVNLPVSEHRASDFSRILEVWGITLPEGKVAADKTNALHVQTEGQDSRLITYPNVTWIELDKDYLASDSVVTASLEKLRFIESGYLQRAENAPVVWHPLITTSPAAMTVDASNLEQEKAQLELYRNYVPDGKPLVLAAQINGIVNSAFDKDTLQEELKQSHLTTSTNPINVVLVADTDMLRDDFWVEKRELFGNNMVMPTSDNGSFVLNTLDYLTGDDALIQLRTRNSKDRSFSVLDDLKREAESRYREEENRLKESLAQMEKRIRELQTQQNASGELFSKEQAQEITRFREAFLDTRKQLRAVQRDLRQEIDWLGSALALLNILAVPLVLLAGAFILPPLLRQHGKKQYKMTHRKG